VAETVVVVVKVAETVLLAMAKHASGIMLKPTARKTNFVNKESSNEQPLKPWCGATLRHVKMYNNPNKPY
jgi:hypothetical protein